MDHSASLRVVTKAFALTAAMCPPTVFAPRTPNLTKTTISKFLGWSRSRILRYLRNNTVSKEMMRPWRLDSATTVRRNFSLVWTFKTDTNGSVYSLSFVLRQSSCLHGLIQRWWLLKNPLFLSRYQKVMKNLRYLNMQTLRQRRKRNPRKLSLKWCLTNRRIQTSPLNSKDSMLTTH